MGSLLLVVGSCSAGLCVPQVHREIRTPSHPRKEIKDTPLDILRRAVKMIVPPPPSGVTYITFDTVITECKTVMDVLPSVHCDDKEFKVVIEDLVEKIKETGRMICNVHQSEIQKGKALDAFINYY